MDRLSIVISTLFLILTLIINICDGNPVKKRSVCNENEFECQDHTCISKDWLCDFSFDCFDKSDEEGCSNSIEATTSSERESCKEDEFQCVSDGVCIKLSWVCDKGLDCIDKSDELNCFTEQCKQNETRCKETGHCINTQWLCDGERDCVDGSDETDCPQLLTTTELYQTTNIDVEEIYTGIDLDSNLTAEANSYYINKSNFTENDNNNSTDESFDELTSNNTEPFENLTNILDNKNVVEFDIHPLSEVDLDYFIPVNPKESIARLLSESDNETATFFSDDILFTESSENAENTEFNIKDYDIQTTMSKGFEFVVIDNTSIINDNQSTFVTELPEISFRTEQDAINLNDSISFTYSNDISLNDTSTEMPFAFSDSNIFITATFDTAETSSETTEPSSITITTTEISTTTTTTTTTLITTPTTTTTTTTPTTTTTTTTTTTRPTTPYPCGHGEFFCRTDVKCIPVEWRCDHTEDCWDGSDEANCDQVNCPDHMVQCPDTGQCIYYAWICDGSNDCDTGSDERHCRHQ